MSTLKVNTLQNTDGVEVYTAKAWVNFNGTGTVAIRAAGNVSSITDNNPGDYTVNFTNAMPDANYSFAACGSFVVASSNQGTWITPYTSPTTTAFRFQTSTWSSTRVIVDANTIGIAIFR